MKKYKVGIIGATGMVGQRFATLLDNQQGLRFDVQKKKVMYAQNAFQRVCSTLLPRGPGFIIF